MKVLTANCLLTGHPLWYSSDRTWKEDMKKALAVTSSEECSYLTRIAEKAVANNEIIGALWIDVRDSNGILSALRLRERIRACGPTVV
jgi:hypothetical protein